jgi:probable HAF family extracellular repeat protein
MRTPSVLLCLLTTAPAAFAQATFHGLGVGNASAYAISRDGQWITGVGSSGYFRWNASTGYQVIGGNGMAGIPDIANGGSPVGLTLPDTSNGDADTAAVWTPSGTTFIGGLGGQSGPFLSSVYSCSADGGVMAGLGWINGGAAHAFRWTQAGGMIDLGAAGGGSSRANGISPDGNVVVGWDEDSSTGQRRAAIFSGGTINVIGTNGEAYDASKDGSVVVGYENGRLFRWTQATGMVDLGQLPNSDPVWDFAIGESCSADGNTIVGSNGNGFFGTPYRAFVWRAGLGMTDLRTLLVSLGATQAASWVLSDATSISADGRTICGVGYDANFIAQSWIATLPELTGTSFCSGDGSLATACPCANSGTIGRGCENSAYTGGSHLYASGTTAPDKLVFTATDERPGVLSIFLQGDASDAAGTAFGDGVRCVSGNLKRLYAKNADDAGTTSAPAATDLKVSAQSALLGDTILPGSTRYYQVYYRDPDASFCSEPQGSTFNVSNALSIQW